MSQSTGRSRGRARGNKAAKRAAFPFINSQIIAVADRGNLDTLVTTVEHFLPEMNLVNMSTAMHRLAKLTANNARLQNNLARSPVMQGLVESARIALSKCEMGGAPPQCQALSNITWSMANVQVVDLELFDIVVRLSCAHLTNFKPFELSALLWAFAKLDSVNANACACAIPLFRMAASHIPTEIDQFSLRCLVMTVWAFVTARQYHERLFRGVAAPLLHMLYSARCQDLAHVAWAYGSAGVRDDKLFMAISGQALRQMRDFKAEELASIMWAFASVGCLRGELLSASIQAVQGMELQPPQLANVVWALASDGDVAGLSALLVLVPRCTAAIELMEPQELANLTHALAKCFQNMQREHHATGGDLVPPQVADFFAAVARRAPSCLQRMSGQGVAEMAAAFLAAGFTGDSRLFKAIGREVCLRATIFESPALLLLLRNLPAAPRDCCGAAVCSLFSEASRRYETFAPHELQSLAGTCNLFLGLPASSAVGMQRAGIINSCVTLSQASAWPATASHISISLEPQASTDISGGGRAEVPARRGQDSVGDGPGPNPGALGAGATSSGSGGAAAAARQVEQDVGDTFFSAPVVYSVKNTFVDFQVCNDEEDAFTIELPPPLDIIPSCVTPERLENYRVSYQKFRAGDAVGAKGELSTVVSLDLAVSRQPDVCFGMQSTGAASAPARQTRLQREENAQDVNFGGGAVASPQSEASSGFAKVTVGSTVTKSSDYFEDVLLPPLDFMPKVIDLEKLSAFRVEYQRFRAGSASGAKGEIAASAQRKPPSEVEAAVTKFLPPPLDIIPESVCKEKLAQYRVDYQKFRAGDCTGAKGEVTNFVAMDAPPSRLVSESSSTQQPNSFAEEQRASVPPASSNRNRVPMPPVPVLSPPQVSVSVKNTFVHVEVPDERPGIIDASTLRLPPSLPIIPDTVSPEQLDAYRADYQKFRAGSASGAKGEVSMLAALHLTSGAHGADGAGGSF